MKQRISGRDWLDQHSPLLGQFAASIRLEGNDTRPIGFRELIIAILKCIPLWASRFSIFLRNEKGVVLALQPKVSWVRSSPITLFGVVLLFKI